MQKNTALWAMITVVFVGPVMAEDNYSAGRMWGTDPSGTAVDGALESALLHVNNGLAAAQVNAAEEGVLVATGGTGSITVQAIGSQNVNSVSIVGDGNAVSNQAEQNSENTGAVTNNGGISNVN